MPIEQSDNTRVVYPPIIVPTNPKQTKLQQVEPDQLWDADKIREFRNMQNFYNTNFFGFGVGGRQTNYDPRTQQEAIQSNYNYAKGNVQNFAETLLTAGIGEGVGQVVKQAITPTRIGSGAEAVVSSAPASTRVTKVTTIPRSEMHLRNQVPGALKSNYVGTSNGLNTYTQPKVRILSKEQLSKATERLEKLMNSKGWKRITHPNLQGLGFSNGRHVVSDIGPGNVGKDLLGRPRLVDFSIETVPEFRLAMQKQGGKIQKGQQGLSMDEKIERLKHTYWTDTLDKEEMIPVISDQLIETYRKYPESLDSDWDYLINKGHGTYLPIKGVEVRAYKPLHLITYYPMIHPSYNSEEDSNFRWTGHSQLVGVCSKDFDEADYNLITNNCSDETREYLEKVFDKELNPALFTTPGDVRDFALENGGISHNNGRDIFIPMNKEKWEKVRNLQKKKQKDRFNTN